MQSDFVLRLAKCKSLVDAVHNKRGQSFIASKLVCLRESNHKIREIAVGNEHLLTIEKPTAINFFCHCFNSGDIRAYIRFSRGQSPDFLTLNSRNQITFPLFFTAEQINAKTSQTDMRADHNRG